MKRRSLFSILALTALVGVGAAFVPQDNEHAKVGEKVADFTLKNLKGEEISLSDFEDKIVVLQWVNPDCPVCKRVHTTGLVEEMLTEIKQWDDVVHLAVNSTHYMDEEQNAAALKRYELEYPILMDRDGKVGKYFQARTTPHLFVIDKKGVLRYTGAIDDDPRGNKENRTNYALNAVRQIRTGETVTPDTTKPYGCSVKYAR